MSSMYAKYELRKIADESCTRTASVLIEPSFHCALFVPCALPHHFSARTCRLASAFTACQSVFNPRRAAHAKGQQPPAHSSDGVSIRELVCKRRGVYEKSGNSHGWQFSRIRLAGPGARCKVAGGGNEIELLPTLLSGKHFSLLARSTFSWHLFSFRPLR